MIDLKYEYKEELKLEFKEGTNGWYAIHSPSNEQANAILLYKHCLSLVTDDIIKSPEMFHNVIVEDRFFHRREAYNAIILLLSTYFDLTPNDQKRNEEILQQVHSIFNNLCL